MHAQIYLSEKAQIIVVILNKKIQLRLWLPGYARAKYLWDEPKSKGTGKKHRQFGA